MRKLAYIGFRQQIVGLIALTSLTVTLSADLGQSPTPAENTPIPKNAIALEGVPSVRVDTTEEGGERRELDAAEAVKDSLKINISRGAPREARLVRQREIKSGAGNECRRSCRALSRSGGFQREILHVCIR